jgi:hypothetical protein
LTIYPANQINQRHLEGSLAVAQSVNKWGVDGSSKERLDLQEPHKSDIAPVITRYENWVLSSWESIGEERFIIGWNREQWVLDGILYSCCIDRNDKPSYSRLV